MAGAPPNPADAIMQTLPVQDTVHDFWAGARGETDLTDVELATIRAGINTLVGDPTKDNMSGATSGFIKVLNGAWSSTPNDYERKLIDVYEKSYPDFLFAGTKESITYSEIVADLNGQVEKYKDTNRTCKVLSITTAPDEYFDSYDESQRNMIGNFILNFMFPDRNIGGEESGITYDASPNAPRKAFAGIEQVYNYIYPQNITDSAATSFKSKRIRYEFPDAARIVRSNTFTSPGVTMEYVQNGYGALNRYGFNWRFTVNGASVDLPFGPTQSDGPSVNYLLKSYLGTAAGPEKPNMINLAPLVELEGNPILFDIKRTGDFEQVNASLTNPNVIFATIDHLCSFYARINRKPCIWSNNNSTEMILYRFDAPADPGQNHFESYKLRARLLSGWLQAITSGALTEDIEAAIADFQVGTAAYYVTTAKFKKDLPAFIDNIATAEFDLSVSQTQVHVADALTTAIARLKCLDVVNYLQKEFVDRVNEVGMDPAALEAAGNFATNADGAWGISTPDGGATYQITFNGDRYDIETVINDIQSTLNIPVPSKLFHIPGLIINEFQINPKYSNVQLEMLSGDLKEFQLAIRVLIGKLVVHRGTLNTAAQQVVHLSEQFFKQRDGILATFKDSALREGVQSIIDFSLVEGSPLETEEGLRELLGRIVVMIQNTVKFTNETIPAQKVGGQRGGGPSEDYATGFENAITAELKRSETGNASVGQAIDMSELFGDICGRAAAYVESVMSTVENGNLLLNSDPYLPVTNQTLEEIQDQWETEITRIREECLDIYGTGYVPTVTEQRIWTLLSGDNPAVILVVLTIFDNMTTVKLAQFFTEITPTLPRNKRFMYRAPGEWNKLNAHIDVVLNAVARGRLSGEWRNTMQGGLRERRPLYSNARSTDDAVQPVHDEGLRERRRTRRSPRVRQPARKSGSGGQRDDMDSV